MFQTVLNRFSIRKEAKCKAMQAIRNPMTSVIIVEKFKTQ